MRLDVWLETLDRPVGQLERAESKALRFTYAADLSPEARISLAMPIRSEPYSDTACVAFFGNLLFEGRELDRVMAAHRIDRDDIGALLFHLGADCPGAISITPDGTGPGKRPGLFAQDYEEISSEQLNELVRSLHFYGHLPNGTRDPSPLAGVQPKLALVEQNGVFYLPKSGSRAPTTHILKVSPRDDRDLTRHEAALLSLARACGLEVTDSRYLVFEDDQTNAEIGAILSRRFDRSFDGHMIQRLHSEDLAQALGLARALKYERDALRQDHRYCLAAVGKLARGTYAPAAFQMEFLRHTLFNLAVGNTDNHAKNAAILYTEKSGRLAPLYDVVPVMMDTRVTHAFAMRLGGAEYAEDLTLEALEAAMRDLGFARPKFAGQWLKLLRDIVANVAAILEAAGGKSLADAVAAQMQVIEAATGLDLGTPDRDYYPRQTRDDPAPPTGWGGLS